MHDAFGKLSGTVIIKYILSLFCLCCVTDQEY